MKLLLTSAGITNASITKAFFELVGKKPEDTSLVFVPTASNVEIGDKSWLIEDLVKLRSLNLKSIDIADISAIEQKVWQQKFDEADVMFCEGGNTYHLMDWINKSGLTELLPAYLQTKVFVGVSAGSMVTTRGLDIRSSQLLYEEDLDQTEDKHALGLVDFYVIPHLGSSYFTKLREENVREATQKITEKIYVLDDQSALKVVDGNVEVISEGKWFEIN